MPACIAGTLRRRSGRGDAGERRSGHAERYNGWKDGSWRGGARLAGCA